LVKAVRRRDFIKVMFVPATTWSLATRAQQADRLRRIGVLVAHPESDPEYRDMPDPKWH
jgi:hypothetical protein